MRQTLFVYPVASFLRTLPAQKERIGLLQLADDNYREAI